MCLFRRGSYFEHTAFRVPSGSTSDTVSQIAKKKWNWESVDKWRWGIYFNNLVRGDMG
jgi:hypothetical protein